MATLRVSQSINVCLTLAGVLLSVSAARSFASWRWPSPVFTPYTVVLKEVVRDVSGERTASIVTRAIRSDGSFAVQIEHPGEAKRRTERTVWLAKGTKAMLRDELRTKSTWEKQDLRMTYWQRDSRSRCLTSLAGSQSPKETFLGEEYINGFRAARIAPDEVSVFWYALDFGCALIKHRVDFGAGGVSEMTAFSLTAGPPNSALFEIPPHYQEVSPSTLVLTAKDLNETTCRDNLKRLDDNYFSARKGVTNR